MPAKIKLLPSVFSSLYSRIKIFVFAVNSKRHFYFCMIYLRITWKEKKNRGNIYRLQSAVNVRLKLSNRVKLVLILFYSRLYQRTLL